MGKDHHGGKLKDRVNKTDDSERGWGRGEGGVREERIIIIIMFDGRDWRLKELIVRFGQWVVIWEMARKVRVLL